MTLTLLGFGLSACAALTEGNPQKNDPEADADTDADSDADADADTGMALRWDHLDATVTGGEWVGGRIGSWFTSGPDFRDFDPLLCDATAALLASAPATTACPDCSWAFVFLLADSHAVGAACPSLGKMPDVDGFEWTLGFSPTYPLADDAPGPVLWYYYQPPQGDGYWFLLNYGRAETTTSGDYQSVNWYTGDYDSFVRP